MKALVSVKAKNIILKLGRLWVWRRKFWVKMLLDELYSNEAQLSEAALKMETTINVKEKQLSRKEKLILNLKDRETSLSESLSYKTKELAQLTQNYETLKDKYYLVQSLLSASPSPSEHLEKFKRILHEDYMAFANEESSLAEEAEAFLHLQAVEQELEMVTNFPIMYGKSQIAISGGFSSGKTEFLNSLILDKSIRLPTGIETVTSIPTYLTCSDKTEIQGYTSSGGCVSFDDGHLKLISHEYVKSLGFEIRRLMPFLSVRVQLDPKRFNNICFIDTPGYDPASTTDTAEHDRVVAKRFAESAQALLWVMGADSGQVSNSDLTFIESLANFSDIPVYVIISKSESRRDEIDDILDLVDITLSTSGINYLGVSAQDAIFLGDYGHRRMTLETFFSLYNRSSHIEKNLCDKVDAVFQRYKSAIQSDIDRRSLLARSLKSIDLDVFAEGNVALSDTVSEKLGEVSSNFSLDILKKHQKQAEKISKKLQEAISRVFTEIERGASIPSLEQP